ncbi:MAG: Gfo/Idh/MocA family oxidoreductase [Bacteroidia bacterium]|nr:Gfo/Idh/MocA family oxidoreductase [Bacteroidia bacterium]
MGKINWGIIGCGDVTEVKSGPAFNKVKNSSLIAVMRRDAEKAKDYARRHDVPKWYSNATELINDPEVNAIYIATPPSSHEEYTIAAIQAGKPVYVEKPMTVNTASAKRMVQAAKEKNIKLCVAHYRRAQPIYNKIKQLIEDNVIGDIRYARLELNRKPATKEYLTMPHTGWRLDEAIAGGGIFHDISPHQLDLMYYFFGEVGKASGYSTNQLGLYATDDIVAGTILFKNGVLFSGLWCFSAPYEKDSCEIVGSEGKIIFSFFEHKPITILKDGKADTIIFNPLQHVQQPLIERVVEYFLGKGPNPCSGNEGVIIMQLIDKFTAK